MSHPTPSLPAARYLAVAPALFIALPAAAFEWGSGSWGSARWGVLDAVAVPAVYGPLLSMLAVGLAMLAGRQLRKRGDR
jgi:hypothetical protein